MAVQFPIINPPGPNRAERRKAQRRPNHNKPAPPAKAKQKASRKRAQAAQRRNR